MSYYFFYLLLFSLPIQLGKHFWPSYASFFGFRIDYLSPTLYFTDICCLFLFILWFLQWERKRHIKRILFEPVENFSTPFSFRSKNKHQVFEDIKNLFKYPLMFLIIWVLIGILFSKEPRAGFYGFIKLCEMTFLGTFIAKNSKRISYRICAFILSLDILSESLIGFLQFLLHHSLGGMFYFLGERSFTSTTPGIANASINGTLVLRPYGTFPHPNVFAGFLVIAMLFVMQYRQTLRTQKERIFSLLALFVGSGMLFLTLSRVAILLWLMILAIFLKRLRPIPSLLRENNRLVMQKTLWTILGAGFVLFLLATPVVPRFFETHANEESVLIRNQLSQNAFAMLAAYPFLGVGLNNFFVALPSFQKYHSFQALQPVHNIFLLIAAETGIVGLFLFLRLLFLSFQKAWQKLKKGNSFPFLSLLAFCILGFFDHYFLTLQQGQLLTAFIFGFVWAEKKK